MQAHYNINDGTWGDNIVFFPSATEQFDKWDGSAEHVFKIAGHKSPLPIIGETVLVECEKSFLLFKITKIDRCLDPTDMFFGEMLPVKQEKKL